MQAMPGIGDDSLVLVLYGGRALIDPERSAAHCARQSESLSLLTVMLDDPTGYGRIVRNTRGAI
jgi:bifunctional UDP-N-acetylglucosamine pyrophosphorylase/glucosamine-1-phosphate N-acetyltransferase